MLKGKATGEDQVFDVGEIGGEFEFHSERGIPATLM
jgi:hypothetical protein